MNFFDSQTRVWLVLGVTDMRKAINGLSMIVADHLELDVFSGQLFVFCNRTRSIIKILYWDHNGFCLWQKRLEKHLFSWPESEGEVMELGSRELKWLLDGLDPLQAQGHPRLGYSTLN
ncbi:IS66 family insertion sequence element accessory protein TnpB [Desulfovibrio sp. JC022]|uniref:IS66 family insertion sequence element accessory protein TnpB n=1 Tax=Desulfovibrio sp. JC022 TaxID=2593642 RepID=UPI00193EDD1A